jgi:hypothetical protein
MRKDYPYLNSPYGESIQDLIEKNTYLAKIDNFLNQKQYVKVTLLNWQEDPIKDIEGELTSGNIIKDGTSTVRRACSLSISVNGQEYSVDDLQMDYALNKKVFIEIGVKNYTDEYKDYPILWFPQGVFFISDIAISSSTTSAVVLNLTLKDKMAMLNGDIGGQFGSTVVFDEVDTQSASGEYVSEKVLIYDIITELVNHFGGEDLNNILIEDVPLQIKSVMKWTGDNPLYAVYQSGTSASENNLSFQYQLEAPSDSSQTYMIFEYGDDVGYIYSDFVYTDELTASANETVTSVLDKIKSFLGNYEYFYDVFGIFHFREIKNYLNTTQGSTVLSDMEKNDYLIDVTTGKSEYTFSDNSNLLTISANPQYGNIKNDYIVEGLRQMTSSDISYTVKYHLVIDSKPKPGNTYYNFLLYTEQSTGEVKGYFPLILQSEEDLPWPGNFNVIYRLEDENKSVYWDNDSYADVEEVAYYPTSGTGYTTKDWRTELYLQGLLTKNNGLSSDYYYSELKNGQRQMNLSSGSWIDNLYARTRTQKLDVDYYFEELDAFWPTIYNLKDQEFYGQELDAASQRVALNDGNYYLDFIDANESNLGQYSVSNIGRRPDVVVDEDINCLFEPTFPDIVLLNLDDDDVAEQRIECDSQGQAYSQVKGDIFSAFAVGGYCNGAFEQIKYELYCHTDYQKTLSITALPAFYLEPNTRVTMNDKSTNTYGDYIIQNISIPLTPGSSMAVSLNQCINKM